MQRATGTSQPDNGAALLQQGDRLRGRGCDSGDRKYGDVRTRVRLLQEGVRRVAGDAWLGAQQDGQVPRHPLSADVRVVLR